MFITGLASVRVAKNKPDTFFLKNRPDTLFSLFWIFEPLDFIARLVALVLKP